MKAPSKDGGQGRNGRKRLSWAAASQIASNNMRRPLPFACSNGPRLLSRVSAVISCFESILALTDHFPRSAVPASNATCASAGSSRAL